MFYCHEMPYYAYRFADNFQSALLQYPFKGGKVKNIDLSTLNWKLTRVPVTEQVTTDLEIPLMIAKFFNHTFTHHARVEIGTFPNGNPNYIHFFFAIKDPFHTLPRRRVLKRVFKSLFTTGASHVCHCF